MDDVLVFDDVSYTIGKTPILTNLTFTIKKATITGILGPNGVGKSTLLSLMNALRLPTRGHIALFGTETKKLRAEERNAIGVVLQETALYEELTTFENLSFAASLYGLAHAKDRIASVMDLLGLTERANERVATLSGGLRRRITIARAILHKPNLLIIDEPTLGVDFETRHTIWEYMRSLRAEGITVVIATNYFDEAEALCDRIIGLRQGEIVLDGTPEQFVRDVGYALEIACSDASKKIILEKYRTSADVQAIEANAQGVVLSLSALEKKDQLIAAIMEMTTIDGFRLRHPDLAEVFAHLPKHV